MQRSLLKIAEPVPDINNPFGDDKLGRADLSKALTEMISDVEEPLVVALDGAWGTGKTFFLDRLVRNKPGPSNSIESAEHHLACVVYACSKNTDYATSIQTLAQAASSNESLAGIAPALFANSPRWVLDICERATNFEINHESVLNIHKALSHFTKWNDDMW